MSVKYRPCPACDGHRFTDPASMARHLAYDHQWTNARYLEAVEKAFAS